MTPHQRQQLVTYLQQNGIVYKEVFDELFDHLSCSIEESMQQTLPFDVAFRRATSSLGGQPAIHQIQAYRKAAIKQQYKRWVKQQYTMALRRPVVVALVIMVGFGLWQVIESTPGANRLHILAGGFTALYIGSWLVPLIQSAYQYRLYRKGRANTPYTLVIKLLNEQNLVILCGFLPVLLGSKTIPSLADLALTWLTCMGLCFQFCITSRHVQVAYTLSTTR
ncbi:hypothetical protein [Fibrella aestuarina]|uniref:hypothetical protein n=1 Tax=Fibrella aestuarina TaxID=651143 RepID=UPI00059D655C|nr:hypothetical protein [Fibrella aestuarina]